MSRGAALVAATRKDLTLRKSILALTLVTLFVSTAWGEQKSFTPDPETEKIVRDFIGECGVPVTLQATNLEQKLPAGATALRIEAQSQSPYCAGFYGVVTTKEGTWVGSPWPLQGTTGSLEDKVRQFAWERLQSTFQAKIDRSRTMGGFYPVELIETTEQGKVSVRGMIDPNGSLLLMGAMRPAGKSAAEHRLAMIDPVLKKAPTRGGKSAAVTVIEFSDFQCPSCRLAAGYMKPLLAKYGDQIRYSRVDLPLASAHPWAFPAAVIGRAIYRQNPEAFWDYKEAIYDNQDKLNIFTLGDFAQGFVTDHGLDLKKYQSDVESDAIKQEILESIGTSYSLPVYGTPTFLVNGEVIVGGSDGKPLEKAIETRLAKK